MIRLASCLAAIALALATTAAAAVTPTDVILVLDNSGSMKKNDPSFLTPVAARRFLESLGPDARVGLLAFDQETRWLVPLGPLDDTTRPEYLKGLESIDYRGLFTDSPKAMERAIYRLKTEGRPEAALSIVFLTDGIVDTGDKARDLDRSRWMQEDLTADAAEAGIRVFGIAFTENADFQLIQALSRRTQGEYYRAFDADDIDGVFDRIVDELERPTLATAPIVAAPPALPVTAPAATATAPVLATETGTAEPELPGAGLPLLAQDTEPAADDDALPVLPQVPTETGEPAALPTLPTLPVVTAEPEASNRPEAPAEPVEPATAAPAPSVAASEPAPASAAPPAAGPPLIWLAAGGGGVIVAGLLATLLFRRRRKPEARESEVPKAFLNDLRGTTERSSYELSDRLLVVGRIRGADENAQYVVIDESTIGRRHALVEYKDHSYWVTDQSSLNGTFINDERIEGEHPLKHGDRVRFHKHEFEFVMMEMFETDRTMISDTRFAEFASELDGSEATQARPRDATSAGGH
jgi:hypothetical protein